MDDCCLLSISQREAHAEECETAYEATSVHEPWKVDKEWAGREASWLKEALKEVNGTQASISSKQSQEAKNAMRKFENDAKGK